jgi:hypothetical protein
MTMPKIKFKTLDAGPKGIRHPGSIHEVDAKEAQALIEGGYAEAVKKEVAANESKADNSTGNGAPDA